MVGDPRTAVEDLLLKAVTYALTPFVVLFIGLTMVRKGRVREGLNYVGRDWRHPI